MTQEQDWAPEGETVDQMDQADQAPRDTHDVVLDGETMPEFAERVGVSAEDIVRLNDRRLQDEARARGFEPMFYRESRDEDGTLRRDPEYHAFPGVRLRVREDPE
jgi:hypothetical protein